MEKARIAAAAVLALLLSLEPAHCKDFPESVLSVDPLAAAGMGASFEYCDYALSHDDVDSFFFRLSASPVICDFGDRVAIGASFESTLMSGPVPAGDSPATIAAFWMNAMQFEYGLYASVDLAGSGIEGCRILAEYSRTSQHPFSGRSQYSQVTTDILMAGMAFPELSLGELRALSYIRAGYGQLFAFWKSSVADLPRVSWMLKPAIEARYALGRSCFAVARAYPQIFIDRFKGKLDADIYAEAGVAIGKGSNSEEFLFSLYATRDSGLLAKAAHPTFESGFSLRFSVDRARPYSGLQP